MPVETKSAHDWERSDLKKLGQVHALDLSHSEEESQCALIRTGWFCNGGGDSMSPIEKCKANCCEQTDESADYP
jgi:hypothetical protein